MRQILQLTTPTAVATVLEAGAAYAVRCVWPRGDRYPARLLVEGIRRQHLAIKLARRLARQVVIPAVVAELADRADLLTQKHGPSGGDPVKQVGTCSA